MGNNMIVPYGLDLGVGAWCIGEEGRGLEPGLDFEGAQDTSIEFKSTRNMNGQG